MPSPFLSLVESWKTLPAGVNWGRPENGTGYMSFLVPLDLGGVTIAAFALRGGCYVDAPDRAVTFQLEVGSASARTRIPLMRIDWRPIAATHRNPAKCGPPHARAVIVGSHVHPFDLNWIEDMERMRTGNLPMAAGLCPDPVDFRALCSFARTCLRIDGMDEIQEPEWTNGLLV